MSTQKGQFVQQEKSAQAAMDDPKYTMYNILRLHNYNVTQLTV